MAKTTETAEKPFVFPMHKIFYEIKSKHKEALLLFRCGDFYEAYCEDAKKCADVLGITMTWRSGVEHNHETYYGAMAGFPYHALETYLPKLIREGIRVAICDQLEDPKLTKKLVKRGITELVTPKTEETMKLNLAKNVNETKNVQTAQVNNPAIEDVAFEVVKSQEAKKSEVRSKKPEVRGENSQFSISTYKTKKGGTAPQIIGFTGEDDPRWKAVKESGVKWASASYRKDISGEKVYLLMFGTKYMQAAQQLCDAYNSGDAKQIAKAQAACQAIYEQAQADGKAKWEAKKAEWKAKAEERKAQKQGSQEPSGESQEVRYSMQEIAAMFERVKRGEKVPELAKIRELLEKAA